MSSNAGGSGLRPENDSERTRGPQYIRDFGRPPISETSRVHLEAWNRAGRDLAWCQQRVLWPGYCLRTYGKYGFVDIDGRRYFPDGSLHALDRPAAPTSTRASSAEPSTSLHRPGPSQPLADARTSPRNTGPALPAQEARLLELRDVRRGAADAAQSNVRSPRNTGSAIPKTFADAKANTKTFADAKAGSTTSADTKANANTSANAKANTAATEQSAADLIPAQKAEDELPAPLRLPKTGFFERMLEKLFPPVPKQAGPDAKQEEAGEDAAASTAEASTASASEDA